MHQQHMQDKTLNFSWPASHVFNILPRTFSFDLGEQLTQAVVLCALFQSSALECPGTGKQNFEHHNPQF